MAPFSSANHHTWLQFHKTCSGRPQPQLNAHCESREGRGAIKLQRGGQFDWTWKKGMWGTKAQSATLSERPETTPERRRGAQPSWVLAPAPGSLIKRSVLPPRSEIPPVPPAVPTPAWPWRGPRCLSKAWQVLSAPKLHEGTS